MATIIFQPWPLPSAFIFFFFLLFTSSLFTLSTSSSSYLHPRHLLQSNSPQNIETFYPFGAAPDLKQPSEITPSFSPPPTSPPVFPSNQPISPPPSHIQVTPPPPSNSVGSITVTKAVAATAASTFVAAGVFFFFLQKYTVARRRRLFDESRKSDMNSQHRAETTVSYDALQLLHGNLKGLIVDENGLDVLYWRKLEGGGSGDGRRGFRKEVLGSGPNEEKRESGNVNSDHGVEIQSGRQVSRVSPEPRDSRIHVSSLPSSKYSNSSSQIQSESKEPVQIFARSSSVSSNSSSRIQEESNVSNGNMNSGHGVKTQSGRQASQVSSEPRDSRIYFSSPPNSKYSDSSSQIQSESEEPVQIFARPSSVSSNSSSRIQEESKISNGNMNSGHGVKTQSGRQASQVSSEPRDSRIYYSSPPNSKYSDSSSQIQSESEEPVQIFARPSSVSSNSSSRIQEESKISNGNFPHHSLVSSNNSSQVQPEMRDPNRISSATSMAATTNVMAMAGPRTPVPIPPLPLPKSEPPPPPPQPPRAPPPPVVAVNKTPAPPPPPPMAIKKNPMPPPPPPRAGGLKPPPAPPSASKGRLSSTNMSEPSSMDSAKESSAGQLKMKPLHWDKVVADPDHSMVWDKIGGGSFRFDDNLMEALFGYVATNRKSTDVIKSSENTGKSSSSQPTQTCLLDPRKSQNIAIVLRSLSLSRQEILDALLNGSGLNADTLEKLTKISPTKEEEAMILEFSGNPLKLPDAESFLYHLLRAVPSPFLRLDAMLFKSIYDSEILHLKESLQTLESACQELRKRGLFLKLLEAVLKAGNRMNAGTARGNAHAFNLTALRKLSDVKSSDGKTTLLHFVVEEVVRSEGKRCLINRNHSLGRSNSNSSPNIVGKEEREKEYIMLGLPVVGGLSVEFSNVKKAATIDYEGFTNACAALTSRVNGIRQFLGGQLLGGGDVFVREMKGFLEAAEEELKVVKEEEARVMELVKRTTEYYQAGASKDKGAHLQLFIIVKDFLGMVDQVCVDIARSQQQKKKPVAGVGGSSPPVKRITVRFPNLPAHFMSDHSRTSSSSDSDDDF